VWWEGFLENVSFEFKMEKSRIMVMVTDGNVTIHDFLLFSGVIFCISPLTCA